MGGARLQRTPDITASVPAEEERLHASGGVRRVSARAASSHRLIHAPATRTRMGRPQSHLSGRPPRTLTWVFASTRMPAGEVGGD